MRLIERVNEIVERASSIHSVAQRLVGTEDERDEARRERDSWRTQCHREVAAREAETNALRAAAQARERALATALSWAMLQCPKPGPHDADGYIETYWQAHGILARPDDDSALDAAIAEAREQQRKDDDDKWELATASAPADETALREFGLRVARATVHATAGRTPQAGDIERLVDAVFRGER